MIASALPQSLISSHHMEWLNARRSGVTLTSAYDASSGNNIVGVGWEDQGL